MGFCGELRVTQTVETWTWSAEGHPPDTSKQPDDHEVETTPVYDMNTCFPPLCPAGTFPLFLPSPPYEHPSTSIVMKTWYTVEPEIPHTKTYYAKKIETTYLTKGQNFSFVCLDPKWLEEYPSFLRDEFAGQDLEAVAAHFAKSE